MPGACENFVSNRSPYETDDLFALTRLKVYDNYGDNNNYNQSAFMPSKAASKMPDEKVIFLYETGPLGYLISTRKALGILLAYKIRDARFQRLLAQWACALCALLGAGACGFSLLPTSWAAGVFASSFCLFAIVLWLGAGDLFLEFALEDERFFEIATRNNALTVFEDEDELLAQPPAFVLARRSCNCKG